VGAGAAGRGPAARAGGAKRGSPPPAAPSVPPAPTFCPQVLRETQHILQAAKSYEESDRFAESVA
jgi:hypothetical protein